MDILNQLGINYTAIYQFVFFAFSLTVLTRLVFKPYSKALEARLEKTKGGEDLAAELNEKSISLQSQYEQGLKALNSEMKLIVDTAKANATSAYEQALNKARHEAEQSIAENRKAIEASAAQVSKEIESQSESVSSAIVKKLIG